LICRFKAQPKSKEFPRKRYFGEIGIILIQGGTPCA
jgi:hypothetical protein